MKTPIQCTAGMDEAGRGPLAGPVVASACILTHEIHLQKGPFPRWCPARTTDIIIADSKRLSAAQRERSFRWLVSHCSFGTGVVSPFCVDVLGLSKATEWAMLMAYEDLCKTSIPQHVFIDGCDRFPLPFPYTSIVRGDFTDARIAAASIIAKVTRDQLMQCANVRFPLYGFHQHKGYGTPAHIRQLRSIGPCFQHRSRFLRKCLLGTAWEIPPQQARNKSKRKRVQLSACERKAHDR